MERNTPRTSWEAAAGSIESVRFFRSPYVRAKCRLIVVLCGAGLVLGCGSSGEGDHSGPRKEKGRLHVDVNFANMCPEFESYLLLPHDIDPGSWADVSVSASDPDEGAELAFAWRATSGIFSELALSETKYLCAAAGEQVLTAEVRDSEGCARELPLDVNCLDR